MIEFKSKSEDEKFNERDIVDSGCRGDVTSSSEDDGQAKEERWSVTDQHNIMHTRETYLMYLNQLLGQRLVSNQGTTGPIAPTMKKKISP